MAGPPYGISSRATYGPVHQPGRDRVDGVAPAVRREVDARQLEHPRRVAAARRGSGAASFQYCGIVLGPLEVLAVERAVERAPGSSRAAARRRSRRSRPRAPAARAGAARRTTAFVPTPSSTASARTTSGTARAVLRSASPARRPGGERLEHRAERRRARRTDAAPTAMITPTSSRPTKNDAVPPPDERRPRAARARRARSRRRSRPGAACSSPRPRSRVRAGPGRRRTSSRGRAGSRSGVDVRATASTVSVYRRTSSP